MENGSAIQKKENFSCLNLLNRTIKIKFSVARK